MAINYDYYRVFFYVGKFGSFTHAAKMFCSNQPNVTRIINNLEEELSCKLFLRSKKGAQLTPEGQKLFQFIEAAFEQIAAGESIINESKFEYIEESVIKKKKIIIKFNLESNEKTC